MVMTVGSTLTTVFLYEPAPSNLIVSRRALPALRNLPFKSSFPKL